VRVVGARHRQRPRRFFRPLSASLRIGARVGFCFMSAVSPPPCTTKPGITGGRPCRRSGRRHVVEEVLRGDRRFLVEQFDREAAERGVESDHGGVRVRLETGRNSERAGVRCHARGGGAEAPAAATRPEWSRLDAMGGQPGNVPGCRGRRARNRSRSRTCDRSGRTPSRRLRVAAAWQRARCREAPAASSAPSRARRSTVAGVRGGGRRAAVLLGTAGRAALPGRRRLRRPDRRGGSRSLPSGRGGRPRRVRLDALARQRTAPRAPRSAASRSRRPAARRRAVQGFPTANSGCRSSCTGAKATATCAMPARQRLGDPAAAAARPRQPVHGTAEMSNGGPEPTWPACSAPWRPSAPGLSTRCRRASVHVTAGSSIDPVAWLVALRERFPSCTLFAWARRRGVPRGKPERLVRVRGESVETVALAGTAPRGGSAAADRALGGRCATAARTARARDRRAAPALGAGAVLRRPRGRRRAAAAQDRTCSTCARTCAQGAPRRTGVAARTRVAPAPDSGRGRRARARRSRGWPSRRQWSAAGSRAGGIPAVEWRRGI